jgi:hypothetical protein
MAGCSGGKGDRLVSSQWKSDESTLMLQKAGSRCMNRQLSRNARRRGSRVQHLIQEPVWQDKDTRRRAQIAHERPAEQALSVARAGKAVRALAGRSQEFATTSIETGCDTAMAGMIAEQGKPRPHDDGALPARG